MCSIFAVAVGVTLATAEPITLPPPDLAGGISLNTALAHRRSVREYADPRLSPDDLGALLWAGQGITSPEGFRTAPSAGGLYPLTLYVATRAVEGLGAAVYRYDPEVHALTLTREPFVPLALWAASLQQEPLRQAPAVIVVAGAVERTAAKYGDRARQYMLIEAGHAAQNILLEAAALGLAAVPVGAFYEGHAKEALGITEEPLLLIPVGKARGGLSPNGEGE
ncbi:MAG: SagB/ThcOx family dehydrogenase [Candidatus Eisenbacteria bacterium]|jgi:SagB-type dehydrogenase family enzyme|nr:SagB/ThcOx family dehydrogenase [Candidatus Eisenbacteria bacterium]